MKNNIWTASGKRVGYTELINNTIIVNNKNKPLLQINDYEIIKIYNSKKIDNSIIIKLYDIYFLHIGEIASIFGVYYSKINKIVKNICSTSKNQGRRNSLFGKKFSEQHKQHISTALLGAKIYNDGKKEYYITKNKNVAENYKIGRLPFSQEHKNKLSKAGIDGKYLSPSERSKIGWQRGKFDKVDFKRGIGGHFSSIKMKKTFYFRSLLELFYIIFYLEENNEIITYLVEPIKIKCDNGSTYTPDILINNTTIIELKAKRFIEKQPKIKEIFMYKVNQAQIYCKKNNLNYKIVFDEDINFNYKTLIHKLKDNDEYFLKKYNIIFNEPNRVWSKK